jgi:ketosteroid isomerase-like protein
LTAKETALQFIDLINTHNADGLAALMSDDHAFIDAQGNQVIGKAQMTGGWRAYFESFPDYRIEITDVFEQNDRVALFGFAGGSYKGKETENWRLPVALKAIVKDCITLWQVFADTRIPFEIIERNS